MLSVEPSFLDLKTPTGPMRTYVYSPTDPRCPGAKYPGLSLYSEIFQQTEPIRRLAVQFAGQGFVVMVPEIYHEHEPPGTVLGYDNVGKNKGNDYKGLRAAGVHFTWHEFNAEHAFMRDEGTRYDPAVARQCLGLAADMFKRVL